jgi:thymidine phosphorylase
METKFNTLKLVHLGIDTQKNMLYSRKDCHICKSEGFEALNRVLITLKGKSCYISLPMALIWESGFIWKRMGRFKSTRKKMVSFSHVQPSINAEHSCENVWGKVGYEALKKSSMILWRTIFQYWNCRFHNCLCWRQLEHKRDNRTHQSNG